MTSFVKAGGSYGSSKASQQSVFTSASELETAMLSVKQIELKGGPLTLAGPFAVTDVGLTVGFSEASSFTAAFRKATGLTPTTYHRSLT
jgi:AraC-like DNA-binding protein